MKIRQEEKLKKIAFLIIVGIILIFMCLLVSTSFGQVQIDSIKTTTSTCPNNGSISVYAKSSNPSLLYSIIAGPLIQPIQTGSVFNALPPGNYTVQVADGLGNTTTKTTVVTGNYLALDLNPLKTDPYCPGNSDGKIIGNRVNNSGYGPFTWQLIAPSPITSAPQSSDTFTNLPAGNYTLRLTDVCGSFRTTVVTLSNPPTASLSFTNPPRVEIVNCNSAMVTLFMQSSMSRFPLTYKFETTNGTYTTTMPTKTDTSTGTTYFTVQQLLSNFTYGNSLKVTATNSCGYSVSTNIGTARTFSFCPTYTSNFKNCTYLTQAHFDINNPGCIGANDLFTGLSAPVSYKFIDAATSAIADSGTLAGDPAHLWYTTISGVTIKPVPGNKTYTLTIKDGCGNVYTNSYTITNPTPPAPRIDAKTITRISCFDSTATISIATNYFKSEPHLILLSGPSSVGSTKPGYVFHDTYSYPDTFNYTNWGGGSDARYGFDITNLGPGTYYFKIIDSCGSEVDDSFVIKKTDVTNFSYKFSYKKGCLGKNEIHYTINSGSGYVLVSYPVSAYKYYQNNSIIKDSILNIPSGTYQVSYTYEAYPGAIPANSSKLACTTVSDNITIQGYQTPTILTSNTILCHNTINTVVLPDSSKGVPPYKYEIISGPQVFPVQNSNIFQLSTPGTYTVRIYDICGNGSTKQIFVDNNAFPPIGIKKSCNSVHLVYPTSSYYTYQWKKPNGTIFKGDSIVINPVTPADTGTYAISKIVSINGCKDTLHTTFHLTLPNFFQQTIPFCNGNSVQVGTKTYSLPGVYKDTLHTSAGCDSIVVTTLKVLPQKIINNNKSICKGDHLTIGSNIYTSPGTYKDSTLNSSGCYDIIITTLTVIGIPDTISKTICSGDSVKTKNIFYKTNGFYADTLVSQLGCDSIVVLHLTVIPNTVVAAFVANPSNGFVPFTTNFINQSSGALNYNWSFGNTATSTSFQPSATYTKQGDYTVTLIASDNNCSSTASTIIHVDAFDLQSQLCSGLSGLPIFSEDFGSGIASFGPALPAGVTNYTYQVPAGAGGIVDNQYVISNSSCFVYNTGWWKCNGDHTGNPNGYMMVVNGSTTQSEVYRKHITGLCPNTRYVLSAWVANANAFDDFCGSAYVYANIDFTAEYPAGTIISSINTDTLSYAGTNLAWVNAGVTFVTQAGQTSADVVIYNKGAGACGNDFVIDDISLVHCPGAINPDITVTKNNFCQNDTITFSQSGATGYSTPQYQWQYSTPNSNTFTDIPGATNSSYSITGATAANSGSYQLLVSENGNINSPNCRIILGPKTITESSSPANINLGNDTTLCQGQSITVNAGKGYTAYYWNNDFSDSTKSTITLNATGNYWVTVKNKAGCLATDSIKIKTLYPLPTADAGADKNICAGNTVELTASGGDTYQWTPGGKTDATIKVSPSITTTYTVTVYDIHHCSATDMVTVYINPSTMSSPFQSSTLEHCFEEGSYTLEAIGGNSFLWSNTGDTTQSINVTSEGTYTVTVYNETGCYVTGSVFVKEYCAPRIFIPKAFSPNGDGENDDLEIFGKYFTDFKITIFNRWGEIIFISTDKDIRWNGKYRGEDMQIGTYPYIVNYRGEYDNGSKEKMIKESVTLIR